MGETDPLGNRLDDVRTRLVQAREDRDELATEIEREFSAELPDGFTVDVSPADGRTGYAVEFEPDEFMRRKADEFGDTVLCTNLVTGRFYVGLMEDEIIRRLDIDPDEVIDRSQGEVKVALQEIVRVVQDEHDEGAPIEKVTEYATALGMAEDAAQKELNRLNQNGILYKPSNDHIRTI